MQLVIVDTTQIQPYIFGSNRLRENAGASYLVAKATGVWALEEIIKLSKPHNICNASALELDKQLDEALHIEDFGEGALAAEVIYAGGGNTMALFREKRDAEEFIRGLSRRALVDAPGLQLIIASREFDWDEQLLAEQVDEVFARDLAKQKRERAASAQLLGLGVTVMCQSTGLPAVGKTEKIGNDATSIYPASAEIHAKIVAASVANERLRELFDDGLKGTPNPSSGAERSYDFPLDLDKLGRSVGEHSYIAVIHADGDGMGQRIREISGDCRRKADDGSCIAVNRKYVERLRGFSYAVTAAAHAALGKIIETLVNNIDQHGEIVHPDAVGGGNAAVAPIALKLEDHKYLLPFRPIVFGGDDVTFVCDGRLGLVLATLYALEFAAQTKDRPMCGGTITARAGVAIVKTHYPFARAYALADDLGKSAKRYRRELRNDNEGWDGTCLDWHFALSGLAGDIEEIRQREYTVGKNNKLHLRPLALADNPVDDYRSWPTARQLLRDFQDEEKWAGRRNKVKALRDALREGPEAVKQFLAQYRAELPEPGSTAPSELAESGWAGWNNSDSGRCGYFDAIEAADWFMPLKGVETDGA